MTLTSPHMNGEERPSMTRVTSSAQRQAERAQLIAPQVFFASEEELVELRRLDARARQHRMRLAAMMDVVLEQVLQDVRDLGRRRLAVEPRQVPVALQHLLGLPLA